MSALWTAGPLGYAEGPEGRLIRIETNSAAPAQ